MCSLFTTCALRCGYCTLAENGSVLDHKQLNPYKNKAFVNNIAGFFNSRTTNNRKWHLLLTGGEPLLMPNLVQFCDALFSHENKVAFYTALFVSEKHSSIKYLLQKSSAEIDYIMASFHPQAEGNADDFFHKVKLLKTSGHKILVRYVAHPKRLNSLASCFSRCKDLDITCFVTNAMTSKYPQGYSSGEKDLISSYFSSDMQVILMEGGINTTGVLCDAGKRYLAANFLSGDITPCVALSSPILGNIHSNTLDLIDTPSLCPSPGIDCNGEAHFFEELHVDLARNSGLVQFDKQKSGFVHPMSLAEQESVKERFLKSELSFSQRITSKTVEDDTVLILEKATVTQRYREWNARYYPSDKTGTRDGTESDAGEL